MKAILLIFYMFATVILLQFVLNQRPSELQTKFSDGLLFQHVPGLSQLALR